MKYVVVGTAGHIDHGKSALVEALTGTNPDRLEEEKRRGITIDLGFAHVDLGDGLRIAFIDVPGHERFIRNMLAGVGGIDMVLMVVAADESIKPQTREHFDICNLLGIRKGLIAITKIDLVEREIVELVSLEIQDFVAGSFLEGAPMVPVSARSGEGLDKLKAEIRRLSLEISPRPSDLPFRLPIDRAFVMKGFGAVVTGTLVAGKIRKEEEVEIFPLGRKARVRGVEVHNEPSDEAAPGQRTAINLAGVEARELARGMVLAPPGMFETTTRLDCVLSLLPSARPLKTRTSVHFHCAAAEIVAEAVLLEEKTIEPGRRAYAQLRLAEPGLFLPGDRFILRQLSPVSTIGGGIVLDNSPPRHRRLDPRVRAWLEVLEKGDAEARVEILTRREGEISLSALVSRTGWHLAEALRIGKSLEDKKRLVLIGSPPNLFVHREHFQLLAIKVVEELEKFHADQPLISGLAKEDLRGRCGVTPGKRPGGAPESDGSAQAAATPSAALFNAVLQSLAGQGKVALDGETVRRAGRGVQLTSEELAAKEKISRAFEGAGLTVPAAQEVLSALGIDERRAGRILQILLKEKVLVRVAEELIFHHTALEKLRESLVRRKARSPRINVGQFKDMTGLSRKYAIPLLEYLDRERLTRRDGDERIIL